MLTVVVRQKVQDLAVWQKTFDAEKTMRDTAGATLWSATHEVADPNVVVVISDWDSLEAARKFMDSARATFAQSGVLSTDVRVFDSEIKL
jgi:heme-degrading monooxygenase HmoA